jgi:hypothetical protein
MHPEISRNQNYDNHYADDSKDIHSVLLRDDDAADAAMVIDYRHRLYPQ